MAHGFIMFSHQYTFLVYEYALSLLSYVLTEACPSDLLKLFPITWCKMNVKCKYHQEHKITNRSHNISKKEKHNQEKKHNYSWYKPFPNGSFMTWFYHFYPHYSNFHRVMDVLPRIISPHWCLPQPPVPQRLEHWNAAKVVAWCRKSSMFNKKRDQHGSSNMSTGYCPKVSLLFLSFGKHHVLQFIALNLLELEMLASDGIFINAIRP